MTDAEQALAIATLSLIVGGGSLSWNIFTWVRQRAKMRLTLTWGHMDPDGEIIVDTTSHDLADAVALDDRYGGAGMPMVVVKIRNGGRGPMSVQDAGFEFPAGYTYRDGAVNDHEKIPGLLDRALQTRLRSR